MIKLLQDILFVGFVESVAIALIAAVRSDCFSENSADSVSSQIMRVIMGVRSLFGEASAPQSIGAKGFSPTVTASNALGKLALTTAVSAMRWHF